MPITAVGEVEVGAPSSAGTDGGHWLAAGLFRFMEVRAETAQRAQLSATLLFDVYDSDDSA